MDTLTPLQRHLAMSHNRSKETSPEVTVRSALFKMGFRFRKNDRRYTGTPDIVFPHYHAVIFVNGCFWHGHERCPKFRLPKTNTEFWKKKIERNRARDKDDVLALTKDLWRVGVVWECSITGKNRANRINDIACEISLWLEEGFGEVYKEFGNTIPSHRSILLN